MEKPSLLGVPDPNGETETRRGEAAEPLMAGKRGLVMGVANERSIAWGIARALHAQGAALAFSYQGEAFERRVKPLAQSLGAEFTRPCDADKADDLESLFEDLPTPTATSSRAAISTPRATTSPRRSRSPATPSPRWPSAPPRLWTAVAAC